MVGQTVSHYRIGATTLGLLALSLLSRPSTAAAQIGPRANLDCTEITEVEELMADRTQSGYYDRPREP